MNSVTFEMVIAIISLVIYHFAEMLKDAEDANNHPLEMDLFPTTDDRTSEKFYTFVALKYMQPLGIDPHTAEGRSMMEKTAAGVAEGTYLGISFIEAFVDTIMDGHGKSVDCYTAPNIWRPMRSEQDREHSIEHARTVEPELYLNPHIPINNNYSFRASVGMSGRYPVIRYALQHNGKCFVFMSVDPPGRFHDATRNPFYEAAEIAHITVRGTKSTLYPPEDDGLVGRSRIPDPS